MEELWLCGVCSKQLNSFQHKSDKQYTFLRERQPSIERHLSLGVEAIGDAMRRCRPRWHGDGDTERKGDVNWVKACVRLLVEVTRQYTVSADMRLQKLTLDGVNWKVMGNTRLDRVINLDIWQEAHMYPMAEFLREKRLRWFGHVQRRDNREAMRKILQMTVDGKQNRVRPKLRWRDLVKEDMARNQMTTEMAEDRTYLAWHDSSRHSIER